MKASPFSSARMNNILLHKEQEHELRQMTKNSLSKRETCHSAGRGTHYPKSVDSKQEMELLLGLVIPNPFRPFGLRLCFGLPKTFASIV
jgi:hypothetical protein